MYIADLRIGYILGNFKHTTDIHISICNIMVVIPFNNKKTKFILQIEAFRELRSANGKIRHNFRPIQPIGDRVVFYNVDNNYFNYNEIDDPDEATGGPNRRKKGHNNSSTIRVNSYIFLSIFILLLPY